MFKLLYKLRQNEDQSKQPIGSCLPNSCIAAAVELLIGALSSRRKIVISRGLGEHVGEGVWCLLKRHADTGLALTSTVLTATYVRAHVSAANCS